MTSAVGDGLHMSVFLSLSGEETERRLALQILSCVYIYIVSASENLVILKWFTVQDEPFSSNRLETKMLTYF